MVTPEQFERWHDFSLRMARTCFTRKRNPSPAEIEENVEHFFECIDPEDLLSFVNWDHSDPYPEGSRRYCRKDLGWCPYCHGRKQPNCPRGCDDGHIYEYESAMLVTDICKEHEDGWNPHYWSDESEAQREKHYDQFVNPVVCCIRAGLDVAIGERVGVMGYTAGDLRKMYPDGVPDWITGGKDHRWSYAFGGEQNGTFAEMPDEAELLL